jgi:hypothetical protein
MRSVRRNGRDSDKNANIFGLSARESGGFCGRRSLGRRFRQALETVSPATLALEGDQ